MQNDRTKRHNPEGRQPEQPDPGTKRVRHGPGTDPCKKRMAWQVSKEANAAGVKRTKHEGLYDGVRYLITNTRRVAYSDWFDRIDHRLRSLKGILRLYVESNMLSIADPVSGRVPALHDNTEAVGAVLFDENGAYRGIAVPVVEGESHATRIIETGSGHSSYVLITATEKQAAIALRRCKQTTNEPVITDESLSQSIKNLSFWLFLQHMFLDDIRDVGGSAPERAVNSFNAFLQRLTGINERTRSVLSRYEFHKSEIDFLKEMDTSQLARHINTGLDRSIELQKLLLENEEPTLTTAIVPLGYYDGSNKNGHQIALLVHEQPGRTIVAVSDTGETVLTYHHGAMTSNSDTAIVAMGHTDLAKGRGILDYCIKMTGAIRSAQMLSILRMLILERCGCEFVYQLRLNGSDANSPPARNDDRHLAVRFLRSGRNRIVSHTQRGGTCTFYSTLWLLGIADAIIERPNVADHILLGSTEAVTDNNKYILDRICHIDKEMKRLALGSLIMP